MNTQKRMQFLVFQLNLLQLQNKIEKCPFVLGQTNLSFLSLGTSKILILGSLMSLKVIYFKSIFRIDFYIKRLIYMQESGINITKLLCSREFKRKKKLL